MKIMRMRIVKPYIYMVFITFLVGVSMVSYAENVNNEGHNLCVRFEEYVSEEEVPSKWRTNFEGKPLSYFVNRGNGSQRITVKLSNATPNEGYKIDFSKATYMLSDGSTNPTGVVMDEKGKATFSFILKDSQEFSVVGLPDGVEYSVKEDYDKLGVDSKGKMKPETVDEEGYWEWSVVGIPNYLSDKEGVISGEDVSISFLNKGIYRYPSEECLDKAIKEERKFGTIVCMVAFGILVLGIILAVALSGNQKSSLEY